MAATILVGGVETFSTVDYPGQIAAVVFLQGCPWRCPFCYNASLQEIGRPTNFVWEKFLEFLHKRRGMLDAVVFSGGEPLVQNGLGEAMSEVKALGYKIGLHTGGYRPRKLAEVLPVVDWVGFDIKAPFDAERYQQVTKTDHLSAVQDSLELMLASGKPFECRTTCDPRLLVPADIRRMAENLRARGVKRYFLQKYRPVPGDDISTEESCENFFEDAVLLKEIGSWFEEFSVRK